MKNLLCIIYIRYFELILLNLLNNFRWSGIFDRNFKGFRRFLRSFVSGWISYQKWFFLMIHHQSFSKLIKSFANFFLSDWYLQVRKYGVMKVFFLWFLINKNKWKNLFPWNSIYVLSLYLRWLHFFFLLLIRLWYSNHSNNENSIFLWNLVWILHHFVCVKSNQKFLGFGFLFGISELFFSIFL